MTKDEETLITGCLNILLGLAILAASTAVVCAVVKLFFFS